VLVEEFDENQKFFEESKKKYQGPAFERYLQGQFGHDQNEIHWKKLRTERKITSLILAPRFPC
jgi:hypothetical protein